MFSRERELYKDINANKNASIQCIQAKPAVTFAAASHLSNYSSIPNPNQGTPGISFYTYHPPSNHDSNCAVSHIDNFSL